MLNTKQVEKNGSLYCYTYLNDFNKKGHKKTKLAFIIHIPVNEAERCLSNYYEVDTKEGYKDDVVVMFAIVSTIKRLCKLNSR